MIDDSTVIRRNERIEHRSLGEEQGAVLLHLETGAYHGVNDVGSLVWSLLDDGIRFGDLLNELKQRLEDTPPNLREEIAEFLEELASRDLVVTGTEAT